MLQGQHFRNGGILATACTLTLTAFIIASSGCIPRAKAPEHLRILFTTDTQGNFTPCGCAGGPRGGMEYRSTAISQAKADAPGPVLLVDTGNFTTGFGSDLERTKAEFVARAMVQLGYDAVCVGSMDAKMPRLAVLRHKTEFGLPLTSATYTYEDEKTGDRLFSYPSSVVVDMDGFRVGFVGHALNDINAEALGVQNTPDVPADELVQLISEVYTEGGAAIVILLTDLSTSQQDADIVGSRFIVASVVIAGTSAPTELTEEKSGSDVSHPLVIPRAASWGRSLGVLDLDLSPNGGIIGYSLKYIDLNEDLEKDPMLADLTEEYLEEIEREPTGVPELRQVGFIGPAACRQCHGGQYESWEETRHARAWDTLEDTGRLREAACVPCHTTGYGGSEAFPSQMVPMDFRGVSCEACHGPGEVHIAYQRWKIYGELTGEYGSEDLEDPVVLVPPEDTCTRCHVPPYDEGWLYYTKLDRVRHE